MKARDLLSPSKMMAKVFSPVQHALGTLLVMPLRSLADLLAWEDPFATSWLYCGVFLLTILLLTIPLVTFLFVWGLRLVGIAAFGPHMHWVGLRMAESWEATRKEEAEFAAMSSSEKKRIIREYREAQVRCLSICLVTHTVSHTPPSLALCVRYESTRKRCSRRPRANQWRYVSVSSRRRAS